MNKVFPEDTWWDLWLDRHPKVDRILLRGRRLRWRVQRAIPDYLIRRKFKPGVFYEDCANEPLILIGIRDGETLRGISLKDGLERWCDLFHCGPTIITETEAKARAKEIRDDNYGQGAHTPRDA